MKLVVGKGSWVMRATYAEKRLSGVNGVASVNVGARFKQVISLRRSTVGERAVNPVQ